MKSPKISGIRIFFSIAANTLLLSFALPHALYGQQILSDATENTAATPAAHPATLTDLLDASFKAFQAGTLDVALDKVNQAIALDSQSKDAHMLRASIYASQKDWDKADSEYQVALTIDPNYSSAKFDKAELKFMQKKYDEARVGFLELKNDKDLSDFAAYKAFLCNLFGGHEDAAAKDLDAFNQAGGNPSYYFGNAAWDLFHHKDAEAADWLKSASRIYADVPQKFASYTRSLTTLGYLPIHPSTASAQ